MQERGAATITQLLSASQRADLVYSSSELKRYLGYYEREHNMLIEKRECDDGITLILGIPHGTVGLIHVFEGEKGAKVLLVSEKDAAIKATVKNFSDLPSSGGWAVYDNIFDQIGLCNRPFSNGAAENAVHIVNYFKSTWSRMVSSNRK